MAVLLETSLGELVIDLYTKECPIACENFLNLCKIKYYNGCLFYNVQSGFIVQTGDPSGNGKGGKSLEGVLKNNPHHMFKDEIHKSMRFDRLGCVGMAHINDQPDSNRSQFFITLRGEDLDMFDEKYTLFGMVTEGFEVLQKFNELYCDEDGRPFQDIRIKHSAVLDDPFPDPTGLIIPPSSPDYEIPPEEIVKRRIKYEELTETKEDVEHEIELDASIQRKEAQSRAIILEMTGDLPDADVKPPAEVLFVCKLNGVTRDEDLELIFSRFGKIVSCEIIRDAKSGESLNYAFIQFDNESSCITAYEKMNNVLIDDRRIKVDFSQSVSHLWNRFLQQPRKKNLNNGAAIKPINNAATRPVITRPVVTRPVSKRDRSVDRDTRAERDHDSKHRHSDRDINNKRDRFDYEARRSHRDNSRDRVRDHDRHRDNSRDRHRDSRDHHHRDDRRYDR